MPRSQPPSFSPLPGLAVLRSALDRSPDAGARLGARIHELFGADEVLLCASGTQALQLAIVGAAAEVGDRGGLVALPAFSCYDVASAAIGAECQVAFYDLDPATLTPDLSSLEAALATGARVVVVAPFCGLQPDWEEIRALVARSGAMLIEDAAQSFGSRWRGRRAGGLGDLSVLSFGRGKGWTGTGGGALLGRRELLDRLRPQLAQPPRTARLELLVRGLGQWGLGRPGLYWMPLAIPGLSLGATVYHPPVRPRTLAPAAASLALRTLEPSEREAQHRRSCAAAFRHALAATPHGGFRVPSEREGSEPGYLRFPLVVPEGSALRTHPRARSLGIFPSYPQALPTLSVLAGRVLSTSRSYPGALTLSKQLVTLPTHSLIEPDDLRRIHRFVAAAGRDGPTAEHRGATDGPP